MYSLWKNSINFDNKFSKLDKSLDCDVCIVGGGIFGISCAYYLSKAGLKVIVLEKDRLPFVGYYSNLLENVFVATGFKKWGMTLSNVSANIICDMILGNNNEYFNLFDSTRIDPIKNFDEVKNMTVDTASFLIIDKLKIMDFDFSSIPVDSGKVIDIDGKKVGVYKDKDSKLQFVNPICTHLGCLLSWNDVDKTWDCPCHGSRFDHNGKNLYGPAFKDLKKFEL